MYDSLSGFYPDAKAVIASEGMSYMKILGMYAPFTIEANYNAKCAGLCETVHGVS